ncbi:MAG: hypothetical protein WDW38_007981 [Sanguina aurantia]
MVKPTEVTVVLRCKVAVCGDAAVGKSALISMFTSKGQKFPKAYSMTSGVEVIVAPVPVPDTTAMVELFLFDTAGNDLYKDSVSQYWNGVYYAILVYDVTDADSFEACKSWYEELKRARWGDPVIPLTIAVVDSYDMVPGDWTNFVKNFHLDGYGGTFAQINPAPPSGTNNCLDPDALAGLSQDSGYDDGETLLDAEYSTAMAPGANIQVAGYTDTCRNY